MNTKTTRRAAHDESCACSTCAQSRSRVKAVERARWDTARIPHGTISGYQYWGCRCMACTEAKTGPEACAARVGQGGVVKLTPRQLEVLTAARDYRVTCNTSPARPDWGTWRIDGEKAVTATVHGLIVRKLLSTVADDEGMEWARPSIKGADLLRSLGAAS